MVLRVTTHLKPFKQPGFTGELSRYKWLFGGFSPPKSDKSSDLNLIYASNYTLCGPKKRSKVKYNQYSLNFNFISGWIEKGFLYSGTGTLEDVYLM